MDLFFILLYTFIYNIGKSECYEGDDDITYLVAVFGDSANELVLGAYGFEVPSKGCKHTIPYACTEGGEGSEFENIHLG